MSHRQSTEEEAPVEDIRLFPDGGAQLIDALRYLLTHRGVSVRTLRAPFFEPGQLLAAGVVGVIARHDLGERVVAGKRRTHNDAGVVAQIVRQTPAVWKLGSLGCGFVAHDQRNTRVAQSVNTGSHGPAGD